MAFVSANTCTTTLFQLSLVSRSGARTEWRHVRIGRATKRAVTSSDSEGLRWGASLAARRLLMRLVTNRTTHHSVMSAEVFLGRATAWRQDAIVEPQQGGGATVLPNCEVRTQRGGRSMGLHSSSYRTGLLILACLYRWRRGTSC